MEDAAQNALHEREENHRKEFEELRQKFQHHLDSEAKESDIREEKILHAYNKLKKINLDLAESLKKREAELTSVGKEYNIIRRKLQEITLSRMKTPYRVLRDDPAVFGDLSSLDSQTYTWAKYAAIEDISHLDKEKYTALIGSLSSVALLDNGQPPKVLRPGLFLNALLSHDIYTAFFQSPFFWLREEELKGGLEVQFDSLYGLAQHANENDSHRWRSDMLRLFLPELHVSSTGNVKVLRDFTQNMIEKVAKARAFYFMTTPASYLFRSDTTDPAFAFSKEMKRLISYYQRAATLSYELWTHRRILKCSTLRDLGGLTYDRDNPKQELHSSVLGFYDVDEHLMGKPITLIVHPLLEVYGFRDELKGYEEGRVVFPAVVWLENPKRRRRPTPS